MDIIIGGGISGLSYALFKNTDDYLVLEKESELGGYCRTTKRNGFVWDYSGHFFHFQDADIKRLIMESLCRQGEVVEVQKCTSIKYGEQLVDFPFQKNIHQLPKDEFIDCLVDLFAAEKTEYSTFKEMLYCKFGKSIAEKFLIPYNEKLYACDLNKLDKDAMGRFFPYAEKEQIVLNFKNANNASYNGAFSYPRGGAMQYVNEVVNQLCTQNIRTGCNVVAIKLKEKKVVLQSGEELHYDNLISTMPFPQLLQMAGVEYDKQNYSWNQVLVFNLGFDRPGPNNTSHWLYFPEKKYSFYRVGFYNNILGQTNTSLYVELGFDHQAKINADAWLEVVLKDLITAGCVSNDQLLVDYQTLVMNPAYVHITDVSMKDVEAKKLLLAKYGVYSIGRYGSWTYCSIEDNVKEARLLAHQLNR